MSPHPLSLAEIGRGKFQRMNVKYLPIISYRMPRMWRVCSRVRFGEDTRGAKFRQLSDISSMFSSVLMMISMMLMGSNWSSSMNISDRRIDFTMLLGRQKSLMTLILLTICWDSSFGLVSLAGLCFFGLFTKTTTTDQSHHQGNKN